jgi:alkylation response protein AidB-like acyl-CoA dehydrogenase
MTALPGYDLGPQAEAMRTEVRDWLKTRWIQQAAPDRATFYLDFDPAVSRQLGEQGWIGLGWPIEAGGQGRSAFEQLVFHEEMCRAGVPVGGHIAVRDIVGPTLIEFGTPEQKAEFLPAFLRGERPFCFGYSEPESGSDLASLRTSAVRDGDGWIINGQKLWTTWGDKAEYVLLAARTDPEAAVPQAGISIFMVPMNSKGITVRPSMALYGHVFCTVFYDDVRVPQSALLGGVNNGWKVVNHALGVERISMGAAVAGVRQFFDELTDYLRTTDLANDGAVRDRIGMLAAEIEVARQLALHSVALAESGVMSLADAAMCKVYTSELAERLTEAAIDILGVNATLLGGAPGVILRGQVVQLLTHAVNQVIGGGTNEIQRSAIAQRGLGLPR